MAHEQGVSALISTDTVIPDLRATSKKQVLQELATKAAALTGEDESHILNTLLERERLGTTGIGRGIAIPHAKLETLDDIVGVFARLEEPVDFDSIDDEPVDLIFLLLAPEESAGEHLKILARVSRMLRNENFCENLRSSNGVDAIISLMNHHESAMAAA